MAVKSDLKLSNNSTVYQLDFLRSTPQARDKGASAWLNSVALEELDLWCKKKGFVSQRHDGIQNLLTSLLSKVCKDVEVEPHLLPMDNDVFNLSSAVKIPEARLDIKAGSL